jgi:hypothetical protein
MTTGIVSANDQTWPNWHRSGGDVFGYIWCEAAIQSAFANGSLCRAPIAPCRQGMSIQRLSPLIVTSFQEEGLRITNEGTALVSCDFVSMIEI